MRFMAVSSGFVQSSPVCRMNARGGETCGGFSATRVFVAKNRGGGLSVYVVSMVVLHYPDQ
jgi:hypothetical protein